MKIRELYEISTNKRWEVIPKQIKYLVDDHRITKPLAIAMDLVVTIWDTTDQKVFLKSITTIKKLCDMGIDIFVITARKEHHRNYTVKQLQDKGIYDYIEDILMCKDQTNIAGSKKDHREEIGRSYHSIMAIGDNVWACILTRMLI